MDSMVCADLVRNTHSRLYAANMIDGPCDQDVNKGSPCMDVENVYKSFPKKFSTETVINMHGYPTYRRRDTAVIAKVRRNNRQYRVDTNYGTAGYAVQPVSAAQVQLPY